MKNISLIALMAAATLAPHNAEAIGAATIAAGEKVQAQDKVIQAAGVTVTKETREQAVAIKAAGQEITAENMADAAAFDAADIDDTAENIAAAIALRGVPGRDVTKENVEAVAKFTADGVALTETAFILKADGKNVTQDMVDRVEAVLAVSPGYDADKFAVAMALGGAGIALDGPNVTAALALKALGGITLNAPNVAAAVALDGVAAIDALNVAAAGRILDPAVGAAVDANTLAAAVYLQTGAAAGLPVADFTAAQLTNTDDLLRGQNGLAQIAAPTLAEIDNRGPVVVPPAVLLGAPNAVVRARIGVLNVANLNNDMRDLFARIPGVTDIEITTARVGRLRDVSDAAGDVEGMLQTIADEIVAAR